MNLTEAFDKFQTNVNADPDEYSKARERRDHFRDAFDKEADVDRTMPSGSLARGSQHRPIHDVDLIVVYDRDEHPEWGAPGESASDALDHLHGRVRALLGINVDDGEGEHLPLVHRASTGNHAVRCYLDEDRNAPKAFTVDVVPALTTGDHLLIPEAKDSKWIETHPKFLIDLVLDRHAAWNRFVPLVRVLKFWNREQGKLMRSLAMEVLALRHLDQDERPQALQRFFTRAAAHIYDPIDDPAGYCGEIDDEFDRDAARERLDEAAGLAWRAIEAERRGETELAICIWRKVFGDQFPEPPGGCDQNGAGSSATGAASVVLPPRKVRDAPQG